MGASLPSIDRALIRTGGLYQFLLLAWPHVEGPGFVPSWHLEEICRHLEAVSRGEITRLVINVPPGTGKSLAVGVFWQAWEWSLRPRTSWICASYDGTLATRDAAKLITLLRSDWYLERWGNLCPKGNLALANFSNLLGGFRFSTSVAGKVTGRHADIQIVDDPIKPRDASGGVNHSRTALEAVSSWWRQTMASRARDPRSFRRVVIMQRLHEDDLAGECIRAGYTLLRLPMRYEEDEPCRTAWGGDRRTEPGALLCPDRYPEEAVRRLEVEEMGPDVAAAQLQQRPTRRGGGIFRRDWWRYWHPDDQDRGQPLPPEGHGIQIQSWDLTFKGSDGSDFVCGGVWWAARGQYLLMDLICERMTFTQTLDAMRHMTAKWPRAHDKLVEDKANGPAVEDALRREIRGITLVSPEGGKEARAHACTPAFASGRVLIPHPSLAGWVKAYQAQHEAFPRSAHDDMVDMTSQALGRLRRHGEDFSRAMARVRGEDT